jgi:hypothetical protein
MTKEQDMKLKKRHPQSFMLEKALGAFYIAFYTLVHLYHLALMGLTLKVH